ncbi:cadherin-related family member 3 [Marmota marmota marmota]|uniref:cadherin-related family member 3 n=1 Tax=Marmota marmota marmota TaxID=9994 RepID=UPI0020922812|nr:cadherin-related family member 3 [Marmota marmota marmota]
MLFFHLFLMVAAPDVLALPKFMIENLSPLLENASQHTRVAVVTVSVSPHTSLVGGPVIINANPVVHPFRLSPRSTHLWDLLTTGVPKLDFESVMLYSLIIYAKDSRGATASQTMLIQIVDVNEPPTFTGSLAPGNQVTEIYILEDTVPGTIIYRATAKDPEDTALEVIFVLEQRISMSCSFLRGCMQIQSHGDHPITYTHCSGPKHTLEPFSLASIIKHRACASNQLLVLTNGAESALYLLHSYICNKVILKMISWASWSKMCCVVTERGTVVTATRLDVETAGFARVQSFSIKACDGDQRCAAIPVTTYIRGINDNAPFCDRYLIRYTGQEVIAKDTVVAKLSCHDLDEPPNAIHYAPSAGPVGSGQLFEQVPKAEHSIRVAQDLDYENPEVVAAGHIYEMMISVFDDLRPSHTVTVTIIVEITPANDFSPVFEAAHYSFSVLETSGAFHKVGRVTAIDEDYPPNCLTYKIIKGDIQVVQRFWIHPLSGMIELTTQPDYESVKQYNLTVEAVDCDTAHPRTGVTTVTVDIEDENDEAPVCTPYLSKAVIFDNVVAGTNVNGFKLSCHDRDSQDFEMRFEIASGNENNHFGFDPIRGSNTPKLIVKNPFKFESGAEPRRQYHLVVHVIDDNLKYGKSSKPRTGTAIIDIYVTRANTPPPPTSSEQRKGLTIVYTAINTYKSRDWYIPFIFTLMAIFFAGLVSWVCFLLWRYGNIMECCHLMTKEVSKSRSKRMKYIAGDNNQKEKVFTGSRSKKLEVLTETIVYETMFDGEAIDPVSGNVYKYNSRTGARKWKKPPRHREEEALTDVYSLPDAHPSEQSTSAQIPLQG